MTPQRRVILEELQRLRTHPTADEMYMIVRRRLPNVSLATVYRNLEVLADNGLIQRLELCPHQRRYDARLEKHYHIRCVSCGRVDDVPVRDFPIIEKIPKRLGGYQVSGYQFVFLGLCPNCRKRMKNKK